MSTREPYLEIIRGDATPEETAALLAALLARASAHAPREAPPATSGNWRYAGRGMRPALRHGPGAWRSAFLPGAQ
ncbi:acyl-CoA carboxylase subunit epsilon [Microbispora triticiradicis]|uniref:acyl-CoA carboxylase subunit epsilon n=1 Tax=Microbispora triticiradicis TaxID=2200763 RepID=UPI001AD76666|nr:acyl-CoA carboxylase subunit epsilon [Microbispora triticiradicis]MBO4271502.1 acyl-CoA carboxylase subunit epsilon [Microbispora triticiradicis]